MPATVVGVLPRQWHIENYLGLPTFFHPPPISLATVVASKENEGLVGGRQDAVGEAEVQTQVIF